MQKPAITYKILYHKKGFIRLEVPYIKKLAWSFLFTNVNRKPPFPVHPGIKDFHINPLNASVIIIYEPDAVDIIKYIDDVVLNSEAIKIIEG